MVIRGVRAGGAGPPSFGNCGTLPGKTLMIRAVALGRTQKITQTELNNDCLSQTSKCAHANLRRMKVFGVNQVKSTRDPTGL